MIDRSKFDTVSNVSSCFRCDQNSLEKTTEEKPDNGHLRSLGERVVLPSFPSLNKLINE